jgi:uncharacterized membrane protein YkoI
MSPSKLLLACCAGFLTTVGSAHAAHTTPLDTCVKASQAKHPGKMVSLASEIEDGKSQFEIDIKADDGTAWEVECSASSGKILRIEREIQPDAAEFKSKAKLSEADARKLALAKYPGEVVHVENDLEDDGEISYEYVIKTKDKYIEIEVDAESGKLAGYEEVLYHIGK